MQWYIWLYGVFAVWVYFDAKDTTVAFSTFG
jgi:hypothetical protein